MTALPPLLFQTAVAASGEAMVITGEAADDHPILYANPAFLRMTGYAMEELQGRNARMLQGAKTDPHVLTNVRRALEDDAQFEGETVNYRKDGRPYRVAWLMSPVCDASGRAAHWISIQRDVTALRAQEGQLRLLVRIPTEAGHRFRREAGQRSDLMSATLPR